MCFDLPNIYGEKSFRSRRRPYVGVFYHDRNIRKGAPLSSVTLPVTTLFVLRQKEMNTAMPREEHFFSFALV
jgi:hypothetical protein